MGAWWRRGAGDTEAGGQEVAHLGADAPDLARAEDLIWAGHDPLLTVGMDGFSPPAGARPRRRIRSRPPVREDISFPKNRLARWKPPPRALARGLHQSSTSRAGAPAAHRRRRGHPGGGVRARQSARPRIKRGRVEGTHWHRRYSLSDVERPPLGHGGGDQGRRSQVPRAMIHTSGGDEMDNLQSLCADDHDL